MKRTLAIVCLLLGTAVLVIGGLWLPNNPGGLEYAIEIVDPRPLAQAAMPKGMEKLGAVHAVIADLPAPNTVRRVILVPEFSKLLSGPEVELGTLPGKGAKPKKTSAAPKGVAGSATGLRLGKASITRSWAETTGGATADIDVVGALQPLGPLADSALIMKDSPASQAMLRGAPGEHAAYLLLASSYAQRGRLLAQLKADPALLPAPEAQILSPAKRPMVSPSVWLAAAIITLCVGLLTIGIGLRDLTKAEVGRRFARK